MIRPTVAAVAGLTLFGAMGAEAAPRVEQLIVFRDGTAKLGRFGTDATKVRTGGRRCRVPRATPLAALVRSRPRGLRVRDFSRSCDPSGLFVRAIGRNPNRGRHGWVYKVGHRQGTTAASDPSGPFGAGRLRRGARVTWFYCVYARGGCQRTLGVRANDAGDGHATVRVRAHDDEGRAAAAEGALVRSGDVTATTDARGVATLRLGPGRHRIHAEHERHVRSFREWVVLR